MYCKLRIEFFYHMKREGNDESKNVTFCTTVGENIIVTIKYEIIMVPSNHSNFQYCNSNIGLFSITPCKVITLNLLCMPLVSVLCFFFDGFLSKIIALLRQLLLFLALKGDSDKITVLFANAFKSVSLLILFASFFVSVLLF